MRNKTKLNFRATIKKKTKNKRMMLCQLPAKALRVILIDYLAGNDKYLGKEFAKVLFHLSKATSLCLARKGILLPCHVNEWCVRRFWRTQYSTAMFMYDVHGGDLNVFDCSRTQWPVCSIETPLHYVLHEYSRKFGTLHG